jgi:hypothetical protein
MRESSRAYRELRACGPGARALALGRAPRAGAFQFTRRPLELGKSPTQFEADSDFAVFHDDAEFKALLETAL